jgi:hypothetical protein
MKWIEDFHLVQSIGLHMRLAEGRHAEIDERRRQMSAAKPARENSRRCLFRHSTQSPGCRIDDE